MSNEIKILFDTDIGCDCDDAGAMAVLHELANQGECSILAVTHCCAGEYNAGCIDAINRYFGRPEIPVGMFHPEDHVVSGEMFTHGQSPGGSRTAFLPGRRVPVR